MSSYNFDVAGNLAYILFVWVHFVAKPISILLTIVEDPKEGNKFFVEESWQQLYNA